MKKIFIVILTIFTALFLNSCSKSDVMLSGDWWTIINDEVGSGDENVVIRFDNSSSTVNFAVKSTNKDEKNYYMVESFARKYTLENTAKGEGIIRIYEKDGTQWPELRFHSLTLVTLGLSHIDETGKEVDVIACFPFFEDTDKKVIKTTDSGYSTRINNLIERFRSVGRLIKN